jgi:hypothetical protein
MDLNLEIRIIIRHLNYYLINEKISDIKIDLIYKDLKKETNVFWKYINNIPYNWKFILKDNVENFSTNMINLIVSDENIIEDNIILGNLNLDLKDFIKIYQIIKLKNLNHQIDYNDIKNIKNIKIYDPTEFREYAPGLYVNNIIKKFFYEKKEVGQFCMDIYILDQNHTSLYSSGEGRDSPNQYPIFEIKQKNYRAVIENKDKESDLINIINENISTNDEFQYNKYSEAFSKIINSNNISLPIIIGIYASQGVGKSHLLKLIKNKSKEEYSTKFQKNKNNIFCNKMIKNDYNYIDINFNAWVFSGSDVLWAGLITTLYDELEEYYGKINMRLNRIEIKLFPTLKDKIKFLIIFILVIIFIIISAILFNNSQVQNYWKYITTGITILLSINFVKDICYMSKYLISSFSEEVTNAASKPDFTNQLGFMNEIKNEILEIIIPILNKNKTRVVIYIDDLDKCSPEKIVSVLEAIQLLLSDSESPFIVFISSDSNILIQAIESYYKNKYNNFIDINGYEYINKMVQIPFYIPNVNLITRFNMLKNITTNQEFKNNKKECFNNIQNYLNVKDKLRYSNMNIDETIKLFYNEFLNLNYKKNNIKQIISNINSYIIKETIDLSEIIIHKDEIINYRNENNIDEKIKTFLSNTEKGLDNINQFDNLEEIFYSLDKLDKHLKEKKIAIYQDRIDTIRSILNNYFNMQKNNIIIKLFKEYSEKETKVFCDLSYYLGNNMNVRKSKRVLNIYNLTRYILPSHLYEFRSFTIQLIILAEFWNYRIAWITLIIEEKHKKSILNNTNFIENIQNTSLKNFYLEEVSEYIYKNKSNISNSLKKTDYNMSDFLNIIEYNNIGLIHFYKLYNYIFNIDQCMKNDLDIFL